MAAVIKIEVQTSGGVESVKQDLQDLSNTAKDSGAGFNALGEIATGMLRAVGEAITGFALKGFEMLAGAVQDGIADAQKNAQIQAQTASVIESTGKAAGVTAEQVADYASALSDAAGQSLFGDDQIQESTNLLLTFTNIKKESLEAATAISVDMAQALGGAPKDAAIQLGKALNDPINGVTALSRVGVSFSKDQKLTIKALQDTGDMAGAQAIILAELNKEFGGSAVAAANATGGWSEFNGRMGEAKEALGAALLPLLSQLAGVLLDDVMPVVEDIAAKFGPFIESLSPIIAQIQGTLQSLATQIIGIWNGAGDATSSFGQQVAYTLDTIIGTAEDTMGPFESIFLVVSSIITNQVIPAFYTVANVLQTQVWPILQDLATAVFPLVGAAIQVLAGFWRDILVPALTMFWSVLTTVVLPVVSALAGWLRDNLPGAIQAVADFLTGTLFPALHTIYDFISVNVIPILQQVAQWLITNVPVAIQAAADFFTTVLWPAIQAVYDFIVISVIPLFTELVNWLQTNIPAALQTLANFWNNTLLPAINAVWAFLQTYVIPLFTALVNLHLAVLGLAVRTLAAVWTQELLPALTKIWTFIQTNLGPIINWLTVTILQPLMQILADLFFTVIGSVLPAFTKLSGLVKDEVSKAFNNLNSYAGAAAGGLSKIGEAVSGVIDWISDLAAKLNSISIPDWLQGHSPPPMADWFSYIGEAVGAVNAQLPTLAMNLAAQVGTSGQSISNTASTRSFTYAPQYNGGAPTEGPMDMALANSLASV